MRGKGNVTDSTKTDFCVIAPENLDKLDSPLGKLRGKGNVTDSVKTEFYVIAPENLDKLDSPLGKLRRGRAMLQIL